MRWSTQNIDITESHVCAGASGHGIANGDSGGPLMMKSSDNRWFQMGIVSFLNPFIPTRQDLLPGVYTNIQVF
ncbi:hypothetical protein PFISCL1PPCAC_11906 [Pristionchus fissidentatus]|uniref:Peptidase S1 domain-containing protein n=1 Tax=Pristionchus fissidentatus TaxID=1538716 RepID=A0AAV5VQJ4_9BILA|nr:hypothetical protein PFISCL1PPCAC_11906 [Pristionchus fissidentatus]